VVEDYITTDLPADVVAKYRTVNSRYGRAIAGLSMGGYGALKIALKRPVQYAVVGSFSGAFGVTVDGRYDKMIESVKAEPLADIFGVTDSDTRRQIFAVRVGLRGERRAKSDQRYS
jgi:S-formylglutathione hydrolase FrmB